MTVDLRKAVKAYGGFSALARRLNVPLSTCHGWKRRKKLPKWRDEQIAQIAAAEGKDVARAVRRRKPRAGRSQ